jgi:hypothetical protein
MVNCPPICHGHAGWQAPLGWPAAAKLEMLLELDSVQELNSAQKLLRRLGLSADGVGLISCPDIPIECRVSMTRHSAAAAARADQPASC